MDLDSAFLVIRALTQYSRIHTHSYTDGRNGNQPTEMETYSFKVIHTPMSCPKDTSNPTSSVTSSMAFYFILTFGEILISY